MNILQIIRKRLTIKKLRAYHSLTNFFIIKINKILIHQLIVLPCNWVATSCKISLLIGPPAQP